MKNIFDLLFFMFIIIFQNLYQIILILFLLYYLNDRQLTYLFIFIILVYVIYQLIHVKKLSIQEIYEYKTPETRSFSKQLKPQHEHMKGKKRIKFIPKISETP